MVVFYQCLAVDVDWCPVERSGRAIADLRPGSTGEPHGDATRQAGAARLAGGSSLHPSSVRRGASRVRGRRSTVPLTQTVHGVFSRSRLGVGLPRRGNLLSLLSGAQISSCRYLVQAFEKCRDKVPHLEQR